tara:strand:+ start:512 stop:664 length:153 start_codon:yes stop_codon:yes gene_type:complete
MLQIFGSIMMITGILVMAGSEHESLLVMLGLASIGMIGFIMGFIMLRMEK